MAGRIRPSHRLWVRLLAPGLFGIGLFGLIGCGGSKDTVAPQASSGETNPSPPSGPHDGAIPAAGSSRPPLPVAAIGSATEPGEDALPFPAPEKGTPEWMLLEIARIRTELNTTSAGSTLGDKARAQQEKIIELARMTIAATHRDAAREQLFNNAVHYLSDARLALAVHGDTEQSRLLVEDADSLYRRNPQSFAAIESAYKIVQIAQRKAEQHGRTNPEWLREFANQARLFADKFPHEPNRCALVLLTAGQLCDREGMTDAAKSCFNLVQQKFPDTIFAEQVNGFLRRLSLVGQPLELAGPTIEGGYVSVDDYAGQNVLVVFWAATSPQFAGDYDRLKQLHEEFAPQGLRVIGVNLDVDEGEIDRFLAEHVLPWSHIFYSELEKRGGRHPLARYYGVQRVPTYWLVDGSGTVAAAPADLDELAQRISDLFARP